MKFLYILLPLLAAPHIVFPCENGFFPQNNLYVAQGSQKVMAKQAESAKLVKILEKQYQNIFKKLNKDLTVNFLWDESNVNAYATRDDQNNPIINITGGMANHELLSQDGLALILCHELGHFLGGAPKKLRGRSTRKSWSSAEGQADYFATAHCLEKVLKKLPPSREEVSFNNEKSSNRTTVKKELSQICQSSLCKRMAWASYNVAEVYASLDFYSGPLSLIYKDEYTVYQTIYNHPNPQCRLDTMIAALKCPNSDEINFNQESELNSACKDPKFRRPRCWFYPEI